MLETMEGTTRPSQRFHAAAHLYRLCAAVAHTLGGLEAKFKVRPPPSSRGEAKFKVHPL